MSVCSKCGSENRDSAKFCDGCGGPLNIPTGKVCVKCSAKNRDSAKFCDECGGSLNIIPPGLCGKCGNQNKDNARFCNECGYDLLKTPSSGNLSSEKNIVDIHDTNEMNKSPEIIKSPVVDDVKNIKQVMLEPDMILNNRYKIVNYIKKGGMGAIYKAIDTTFDTACAVKELIPRENTLKDKAESISWFKREAKILNSLEHPNLPKVFDYFENNGKYYLVMNFVEGEDLEKILHKEGTPGLPEDKVIDWAEQILDILEYIHGQNPQIIYRDIKPPNIMLNKNGKIMLVDFGIARKIEEMGQTQKTKVGTEGYASPEQYVGQALPQSDIYSLGATMYHLLTSILPVGVILSIKNVNPSLSDKIDGIIMKALQPKIEDRFQSAGEMKMALKMTPEDIESFIDMRNSLFDEIEYYKVIKDKILKDGLPLFNKIKESIRKPLKTEG